MSLGIEVVSLNTTLIAMIYVLGVFQSSSHRKSLDILGQDIHEYDDLMGEREDAVDDDFYDRRQRHSQHKNNRDPGFVS